MSIRRHRSSAARSLFRLFYPQAPSLRFGRLGLSTTSPLRGSQTGCVVGGSEQCGFRGSQGSLRMSIRRHRSSAAQTFFCRLYPRLPSVGAGYLRHRHSVARWLKYVRNSEAVGRVCPWVGGRMEPGVWRTGRSDLPGLSPEIWIYNGWN